MLPRRLGLDPYEHPPIAHDAIQGGLTEASGDWPVTVNIPEPFTVSKHFFYCLLDYPFWSFSHFNNLAPHVPW